MSWTWRYESRTGGKVSLPEHPVFPNQSEAETWLGEVWRDLLEEGVEQVFLLEEEREVYGPMSLHPPD